MTLIENELPEDSDLSGLEESVIEGTLSIAEAAVTIYKGQNVMAQYVVNVAEDVVRLDSRIKTLEDSQRELKSEQRTLKSSLKSLESKTESLESKNESLENKNESLESKTESLESSMISIMNELKEARQRELVRDHKGKVQEWRDNFSDYVGFLYDDIAKRFKIPGFLWRELSKELADERREVADDSGFYYSDFDYENADDHSAVFQLPRHSQLRKIYSSLGFSDSEWVQLIKFKKDRNDTRHLDQYQPRQDKKVVRIYFENPIASVLEKVLANLPATKTK
jgi:DNA repair exonuclease SbcCD ATPase subunit